MRRTIVDQVGRPSLFHGRQVTILGLKMYEGAPQSSGGAQPVLARVTLTNASVRCQQVWDQFKVGQRSLHIEEVVYHPNVVAEDLVSALITATLDTGHPRVILFVVQATALALHATEIVRVVLQQRVPQTTFLCEALANPLDADPRAMADIVGMGMRVHLCETTLHELVSSPMFMQSIAVNYTAAD